MDLEYVLLFTAVIFVVGMLSKPLEDKLRIPFAVFLVIIGFIFSELYVAFGYDTGVRSTNFFWLSQFIFIPIIVFSTAFRVSPHLLFKESIAHFIFALPITLITIAIASTGIYYGINHPGFPWIAALLTGTILSATGAHALVGFLHKMQVSDRFINILEIESLFTSVIAVVLFNLLLLTAQEQSPLSVTQVALDFISLLFGGLLIGIIAGYIVLGCIRILDEPLSQTVMLVGIVYAAYTLAEIWGVSGGVTVFAMGLMLGSMGKKAFQKNHHFVERTWDYTYLIALTGVFLLVGVTITTTMFSERWLAMLIGIVALLIGRAVGIYFCLGILNITHKSRSFNFKDQSLLIWAGTHAALPIALAFAIPTTLDYWWTIQSIVFGVVLFSLLIQAPSLRFLLPHKTK